jgi:hypothetical protein
MMFSLLHPLDEFKPLSFANLLSSTFATSSVPRTPDIGVAIDGAADLFCDEAFQIVFASHLVPLIVTQHRETGNTTFWLLRKRAPSAGKLSYERARSRSRRNGGGGGGGGGGGSRMTSFLDGSELRQPAHAAASMLSVRSDASSFLVDDDEDAIVSELLLDAVHTEASQCWSGARVNTNAVLCTHSDGSVLLCLLHASQRRLRAFRLALPDSDDLGESADSLVVAPAFVIEQVASCVATSAAQPLFKDAASTHRFGDLLLLRSDAECTLELCAGGASLLRVPLAQHFAPQRPLTLADPVGNSCRLLTSDWQCHRLSLTFVPETGLALRCIVALGFVLPLPTVASIAQAVTAEASTAAREWECLSSVVDKLLLTGEPFARHTLVALVNGDDVERDLLASTAASDQTGAAPMDTAATDDDWHAFLDDCRVSSDIAFSMLARPQSSRPAAAQAVGATDHALCGRALSALHLVYEDCKLSTLYRVHLPQLAALLARLASAIGWLSYVQFYARDFPDAGIAALAAQGDQGGAPVSVLEFVARRFERSAASRIFPSLQQFNAGDAHRTPKFVDPCRQTKFVLELLDILVRDRAASSSSSTAVPQTPFDSMRGARRLRAPLFTTPTSYPASPAVPSGAVAAGRAFVASPDAEVVEYLVRCGATLDSLDCLPLGVAVPVREAIAACRANPPPHWSAVAFRLVGRPDLAVDADVDASKRQRLDAEALATHTNDGALDVRDIGGATSIDDAVEAKRASANAPGELRQRVCELRFGRDRRLADVARLLAISVPVTLRAGASGGAADHDLVQEQQTWLAHFANRTLALPIGRGMFTFATAAASPADLIARPKFALDGRVLGSNASVQLESSSVAADFGRWPNYHNGAASALRVARDPSVVTSPWIVFNKPPAELTSSYAGTLLALGLTGQLSALALTKVYDFLAIGHEMTSISILIGMAASQRGTMHVDIAKLLTIHLPSLHASSSTDLEVPASLQTAALLGVGLLYESTCHRHMTEVLLEEMGRRATEERHFDRESYALSAGLALGFVALGNGRHASLADLNLVDRLTRYIDGGPVSTELPIDLMMAAPAAPSTLHSTLVSEGGRVNTDLTAPAATLALGLLFLRTNDAEVAARLALPRSSFLLDFVRADFVLLRVLARSLVLWDAVAPSSTWLASNVPPFMRRSFAAVAGDEMVGSDGGGDNGDDDAAADDGAGDFKADIAGRGTVRRGERDSAMLRDASAFALAGGCLALGLRYAGSARRDVAALLTRYVVRFERLARQGGGGAGANAAVARRAAEQCLDVAAMALGCVLAGTGNLDAFRLLRELRARVGPELTYGNHMAISMAIGLLFLSGGCATLGTSNVAIAGLVAALYPRLPQTPTDNMAHLQALRHFYALAVEERLVEVRDVDTGAPCYAPVEVDVSDARGRVHTLSRVAPCLLPDLSSVLRVRVTGARYLPREVPRSALRHNASLVLHVKRYSGFLPYDVDPRGQRSILARSVPKRHVVRGGASHDEFIRSFSADPDVIGFAHSMCGERGNLSPYAARHAAFCASVLYECLTREKAGAIPLHLALHESARIVAAAAEGSAGAIACSPLSPTLAACDIRLVAAYYQSRAQRANGNKQEPLINEAFLYRVLARVDAAFGDAAPYVQASMPAGGEITLRTAAALAYFGVPMQRVLVGAQPQLVAAMANVPSAIASAVAVAWLASAWNGEMPAFRAAQAIAKVLLAQTHQK